MARHDQKPGRARKIRRRQGLAARAAATGRARPAFRRDEDGAQRGVVSRRQEVDPVDHAAQGGTSEGPARRSAREAGDAQHACARRPAEAEAGRRAARVPQQEFGGLDGAESGLGGCRGLDPRQCRVAGAGKPGEIVGEPRRTVALRRGIAPGPAPPGGGAAPATAAGRAWPPRGCRRSARPRGRHRAGVAAPGIRGAAWRTPSPQGRRPRSGG